MHKPQKFRLMTTEIRDNVARLIAQQPIVPLLVVSIDQYEPPRTLSQNSLWWWWMTLLGDHCGYDRKEMDYHVRDRFLERVEVSVGEKTSEYLPSTSDLTKSQMAHLMNQVQPWAVVDLGCMLPSKENRR